MTKILSLLLALALPFYGAQTVIQSPGSATNCTSTTGTSCSITLTQATGTGNLLVFMAAMTGSGHSISSISSSGTWVIPANCSNTTATTSVCFAYCLSSVSGLTSVDATIDTSNVGRSGFAVEVSNSGLGWSFVQAPTGTTGASASTQTGVAFTLTGGTNYALFQGIFAATAAVNSLNTGYTINNSGNSSRALGRLPNTTTATAPTWTLGGASTANMTGLAFVDNAATYKAAHHVLVGWTPARILDDMFPMGRGL